MKVPLATAPGVVRNATASSVQGRWYDANLIRWRSGRMMPVGGWERMTAQPLGSTPRALATWADLSDVRRTAVGCDAHLYVLTDAGDAHDITPDGFVAADAVLDGGGFGTGSFGGEDWGDARADGSVLLARGYTFSLAPWGQDLLACASFDGKLYHWSPTTPGDKAKVVDNAPTGARAIIVTDERHVVMIGPGGFPRRVQWCSSEDFTDWATDSVTNTAGFLDMNTDGLPVALARVREGILIFTEVDVWLLRFVGAPYVYALTRVADTTTLLSPSGVATFGGGAVWMGRESFYAYSGGAVQALPCDVGAFVFGDIDPQAGLYRVHASANGTFPEVWFFYPSAGQTECDRYVIFSYADGTPWWSIGKLDRTVAMPAGVNKWPVMARKDGHLYQHESGWLDAGESRVGQVYATGASFRMSNGVSQMSVLQVYPDLDGAPKAASFTFTVRDTPDGAPRTAGPYLARSDGYMDTRFTGRDVQLTVTATADGLWTLGGPILECKQRGGR